MTESLPPTPYKGLAPYYKEDAPFFFGREKETDIIISNLLASRLTILYGPSGVGKSSVLRAGVAYQIHQASIQNLNDKDNPEYIAVVFNSWRDNPIPLLKQQILNELTPLNIYEKISSFSNSDNDDTLVEFLFTITRLSGSELLIILDQFEEYFFYHPEDQGQSSFAFQFQQAINNSELRVNFLVSLREDALAKLDTFKGKIPNLFDNYLRVNHLGWTAAQKAILQPIEKWNSLLTDGTQKITIEPDLIKVVLEQVSTGKVILGEAKGKLTNLSINTDNSNIQIEAPYLQLVMIRLWNTEKALKSTVLRLTTLQRLGDAEKIIRSHLGSVMEGLNKNEQDAAARVFNYLVTPSGLKVAYTLTDLATYVNISEYQLKQALDKLTKPEFRVLRSVPPSPVKPEIPRYEIFHDALATPILEWRSRYLGYKRRRLGRICMLIGGILLLISEIGFIWNPFDIPLTPYIILASVSVAIMYLYLFLSFKPTITELFFRIIKRKRN